MNRLTIILALALFPVFASLSHGDENDSDKESLQKWYKVEAIIFTQRDVFGDEHTTRDVVMSYPNKLIDLDNNSAGFVALPKGERELGPDAYSLNRTGVYNVLFHKVWRQPGLEPMAAPWINIDVTGENSALNGSLRVYLSSYLHLESNIWLVSYATGLEATVPHDLNSPPPVNTALTTEEPLQTADDAALPTPLPKAWPQPPTSPLALLKSTPEEQSTVKPANEGVIALNTGQRNIEEIILLKQASRLKLNKLHYFDHPKMGLLLKVSRSKAPAVNIPPNTESGDLKSSAQSLTNEPVSGTNTALD